MQSSVDAPAIGSRMLRGGAPSNPRDSAVLLALSVLVTVSGCSSGPAHEAPPIFGTAVLHPPPKPGDIISQTQMCECQVCDPVSCCDGPDDDAPPKTCGDSYDFSANSSCGGLAIKSCASRCTREIWRVHVGQDCTTKRPDTCCSKG